MKQRCAAQENGCLERRSIPAASAPSQRDGSARGLGGLRHLARAAVVDLAERRWKDERAVGINDHVARDRGVLLGPPQQKRMGLDPSGSKATPRWPSPQSVEIICCCRHQTIRARQGQEGGFGTVGVPTGSSALEQTLDVEGPGSIAHNPMISMMQSKFPSR